MKESRIALWLYRALLRLYPAQFRHEFEIEVMSAFRREWSILSNRRPRYGISLR